MKRLLYALPVLIFGTLAYFLFDALGNPPPQELPSVLINKPVPDVTLPPLDAGTEGFSSADFAKGSVTIVNVFSSTCIPCRVEAPYIAQLATLPGVSVFGFVWKDTATNARAFLDELGNPFTRIGLDTEGRAGMEWGIYGWPETFIIDGNGVVRAHFFAITEDNLKSAVLPAIEKARANM